jgi:hypothetical protein
MHIEYETTLDDIADDQVHALARSELARRTRWQIALWIAVLASILLFLLLSLLGATLLERFLVAGFGAVGGSVGYLMSYRRTMKRRVLEYLREQVQSDGPLLLTVELRDDCIWTKQGGTQVSFDWTNLREILDSADGIELRMRDGGSVIVRSRGFPSQAVREEFKEIASKRLERNSGNDAGDGGPTGAIHPC